MAMDAIFFQELILDVFFFFLTIFFFRFLLRKNSLNLPPGPRGWPVIGALPLLGSKPHVTLAKMAQKYGPIMYLKVGARGMVVASTPAAARTFLKTLESNFLNRPPNAGAIHLAYNAQDMVFADYGPKWRLLRKLGNLYLLGAKVLEEWAEIRSRELGHTIQAMCESSKRGEEVAVPEMVNFAIANMLGQVIVSGRVFERQGAAASEFREMVVELMTTAGLFNIGDFVPWMGWMDLQGIERGMKRLHKKFDVLLTKMIEKHGESGRERKGKPDFLDVLIGNQENAVVEKLSMTSIKALLLNLFTAGTDTSSSIIEWALAEMLKNPSILKRAHEEMDQVIGKQRRLEESDIPKLPYLQAICKETFRKHPSTPLSLPRVAAKACQVNNYYIPKNTILSVNIWAIGRDPEVWESPLDFIPERFLCEKNARIDPGGNHFELIPFGSGRRICAGTRMGIVLVEYILGTLIHSFEWEMPNGVELDMEETFGLALQKAVPLSAMVRPRLPLRLNVVSPDLQSSVYHCRNDLSQNKSS